jgi:hypothetical protein
VKHVLLALCLVGSLLVLAPSASAADDPCTPYFGNTTEYFVCHTICSETPCPNPILGPIFQCINGNPLGALACL